MKLSDLRTGAVVHAMSDRSVTGVWLIGGSTTTEGFRAGSVGELVPLIDGLRDELRDTMAIARARVPRLEEFAAGWGRRLLPPAVLGGEVDVVVVVSHSLLHGLPLHVVIGDDGAPVGTRCGFTYASSMTLFVHCAERNVARAVDPQTWTFDAEGEAAGCGYPPPSGTTAGGTDVIHRSPGFVGLAREIAELIDGERAVFGADFGYERASFKSHAWAPARRDVLCAVAHGYLDRDDHRFSGLLLDRGMGLAKRSMPIHGEWVMVKELPLRELPASTRTRGDAEVLTIAELAINIELECRLVLLLGCSAGWSRVLSGDEPASLAEMMLHLGATSAVAPLWDSPYGATRDWALTFMRAWARRGLPKALAAREAQRELTAAGLGPERAGVLAVRGDWL